MGYEKIENSEFNLFLISSRI